MAAKQKNIQEFFLTNDKIFVYISERIAAAVCLHLWKTDRCLFTFMKNWEMFVYIFSHEQLVMISDRLISEADKNEKGFVTFEEFHEAVSEVDIEGKMAFVSFY